MLPTNRSKAGPTEGLTLATLRMRLLALTVPMIEAIDQRGRLERLLGVRVADAWPPIDSSEFITLFGERLRVDPSQNGWGPWLMVLDNEQTIVGDAGFTGKPSDDGVSEIGYGVLPAYRGRGLATEAGRALLRWAFEQGATAITAQCEEDNIGSVRVLEKLGMQTTGRSGRLLSWRVERD